jgi:hypothetical protein
MDLKQILLDFVVFLARNWWIPAALAVLLIIVMVFGQIKSCNANNAQKKLEKKREEIHQKEINVAADETIANVQENRVRESEIKANEKSNISKQAEANFNAVVNRDSGQYDSDYERAKRAYCADHKSDSLCQSLR